MCESVKDGTPRYQSDGRFEIYQYLRATEDQKTEVVTSDHFEDSAPGP